jgi:Glycosyl transferase family 2
MNKGLKLATGDITGILNSDDFYANNTVISDIVREFETKNVKIVFGDLVFFNPDDRQSKFRQEQSYPEIAPTL